MGAAFEAFHAAVSEVTVGLTPPARLVALVLGSGMAPVSVRIRPRAAVAFGDVPGLVPPTVAGHKGQIILGDLGGRPVLAFTGRLHFYEGHPWEQVVRPIEVAAELGAGVLVLTNASGGIAEALEPGSLLALTNHIEWNHPTAWLATLRRSVQDISETSQDGPYSPRLLGLLQQSAQ